MTKSRIWELDALRGLCILFMIFIHFVFDLVAFGGWELHPPAWFTLLQQNGHLFFVLISGICATLSSRHLRRGGIVLSAALLVSYVTLFLDAVIGFTGARIWFGILHLLGLCMVLYTIFKKLPWWALLLLGAGFAALGYWMQTVTLSVPYFFPLGLRSESFFTGSDYVPLFPGFGWFLLGAGLGKSVYRHRRSLLPQALGDTLPLRSLRAVGRHSLEIYLLHQPIITAMVMLFFVKK